MGDLPLLRWAVGALHLPPCYYPGFSSSLPRPSRHLSTSRHHIPATPPARTLRSHFPPRLTVHAGCFSSTTSRFPGTGSRGAELLSNFLGSTHPCHTRTAIGELKGAGLRREPSGSLQKKVVGCTKAPFPKRLHPGGFGGAAGGAASARARACPCPGAPPSDCLPEPVRSGHKGRTRQPMWVWSPASSPPPPPAVLVPLGLVPGFFTCLLRPPLDSLQPRGTRILHLA